LETGVSKDLPYAERDFWDTTPSNGDIVIIGGAAKQAKESDAVALALMDAAKKVSAYYTLQGKVENFTNDNGTGGWGFRSKITTSFRYGADYEAYLENLTYDEATDILRERDSLFVKVRYTPIAPLVLDYQQTRVKGKPEWITKPPKTISGMVAQVGQVLSHEYRKDAVRASWESAAALLLASICGYITRDMTDSTESNYLNTTRTLTSQTAEGEIGGFYVLDVWEDPSNKSVWTLAVATPGGSTTQ
jgi:hypothetical protein